MSFSVGVSIFSEGGDEKAEIGGLAGLILDQGLEEEFIDGENAGRVCNFSDWIAFCESLFHLMIFLIVWSDEMSSLK